MQKLFDDDFVAFREKSLHCSFIGIISITFAQLRVAFSRDVRHYGPKFEPIGGPIGSDKRCLLMRTRAS